MHPKHTMEMQCTHSEFLRELPQACGGRPFEIVDEHVIVHDGDRQIRIAIHDEPVRHLGSLNLPMERIEMSFEGYTDAEADAFLDEFREHILRCGGG